MGKIRVATLGDQSEQQEQKEKRSRQREEKKKREKIHVPGMKGGERVVTMTSDEEVEKLAKIAEDQKKLEEEMASGPVTKAEKPTRKKKAKKVHGKKYTVAFMKVNSDTPYPIAEAVKLLKDITQTKFDASVEVHINTTEKGLRGSVMLPHGTGQTIRIVIVTPTPNGIAMSGVSVGGDEVIEKIAGGWTDFDALIAHPAMMPRLAKVARILGPRGLMPNPKAGTISDKPETVAKKLSAGEVQYKTESEFPIIHQVIGKISFDEKKLVENYQAFIKAVAPSKIKSVTLKSTMSPGIKVATS